MKKMENVVYILGAGFSAPLGLPVMSNFLMKAKDMFASNPTKFSYFEDVFKTIKDMSVAKNYFNTDLFNIEEILSILEMDGYLQETEKKTDFTEFLSSVIQYYTPPILGYPTKYPANWYQVLLGQTNLWNWYGCFLGNLINLKLFRLTVDLGAKSEPKAAFNYQVITLNYDMVLENAWNFVREITDEVPVEDPMIELPLFKLHGSSDLASTIVPPTWNKMSKTLLKEVWKNAWKSLSNANYIRIIGYSLPIADSYIKYLLKASILNTVNLKAIDVICLDNNGEVKKRYDDFIDFNFYRFRNGNVKDYLEHNFENHNRRFERLLGPNSENEASYEFLEESHEQFMTSK